MIVQAMLLADVLSYHAMFVDVVREMIDRQALSVEDARVRCG